jgi:hypothetical protein
VTALPFTRPIAGLLYLCTVPIAEINLPVNNIKILSVEQKCFYIGFMSPATIKGTKVFT